MQGHVQQAQQQQQQPSTHLKDVSDGRLLTTQLPTPLADTNLLCAGMHRYGRAYAAAQP
jgi:hypothetical protein